MQREGERERERYRWREGERYREMDRDREREREEGKEDRGGEDTEIHTEREREADGERKEIYNTYKESAKRQTERFEHRLQRGARRGSRESHSRRAEEGFPLQRPVEDRDMSNGEAQSPQRPSDRTTGRRRVGDHRRLSQQRRGSRSHNTDHMLLRVGRGGGSPRKGHLGEKWRHATGM